MYALGVILNNIVLSYIINPGYYFTFPVTFATQVRDIHFISAGIRICTGQDIVLAVTLLAAGCIGIISQQSLSVYPPDVIVQLLGMAVAAIDRIQIICMRETFVCRIGMTREAAVAMMDRT